MEVKKRKGKMVAGVVSALIAVLTISMLLPVVSTTLGSADNADRELGVNSSLSGHLSGAGKMDYYKIVVNSGTKLTVKTDGPDSSNVDFDLYIKKDAKPTTSSYLARGYTSSSDENVSVSNPAGTYYVMVYAYKGSGDYTINAILEGNGGSGGNGGNTDIVEVPPGTTVTSSLSGPGDAKYFKTTAIFVVPGQLKIILDGPNSGADFDLYVKLDQIPTRTNYDFRSATSSADESVMTAGGVLYIMVYAYSGSGQFTIRSEVVSNSGGGNNSGDEIRKMEFSAPYFGPVYGELSSTHTKDYFYFDAPRAAERIKIVLDGPSGADFDLYVKKDELPTTSNYLVRGYTNSADETVIITNQTVSVVPGRYYVMVTRYSGAGQYSLLGILENPNNGNNSGDASDNVIVLQSGSAVSASLSSSNPKAYFKITVNSGSLALKVTLDGPSGADFDLYVKKGALPTTSSYDVRGYTRSADETVTINNPSPGTYYIMVNRCSGSGSFTITASIAS